MEFITAILAAQREGRSGIYDVGTGAARTFLYFDGGKLVFAEQGSLGDTLGRVLVRTGKITSQQYVATLRRMTQRLIDNEQMRFGEVLVELGFLTADQVFEALAAQVKEKVIHSLMLERPSWSFEEGQNTLARGGRFPTRVEPMLLAAMRRLDHDRLDRVLEPARERYPRLLEDAIAIADRFGLSGPEQRFVDLLDGSRTTRELLEGDSRDPASPAALAALIQTACVDLLRANCRSSVSVATTDVAKRAVHDTPVAGPHDRPHEHAAVVPSPVDRVRAEIALKHLMERRATKPRSVSVPTPIGAIPVGLDPRAARLHAEDAFQSGKTLLYGDMPDRALSHLRRAVELCPEASEFELCLRWAEWITVDRAAPERVEAQRNLLRLATQLTEEQPDVGFGSYVLGQFAKAKGDEDRATKHFRRALALDPDLTDAARQLRLARAPK